MVSLRTAVRAFTRRPRARNDTRKGRAQRVEAPWQIMDGYTRGKGKFGVIFVQSGVMLRTCRRESEDIQKLKLIPYPLISHRSAWCTASRGVGFDLLKRSKMRTLARVPRHQANPKSRNTPPEKTAFSILSTTHVVCWCRCGKCVKILHTIVANFDPRF